MATTDELAMQACSVCASTAGLIAMPPASRPPTPCRCGSRRFLRCLPREHAVGAPQGFAAGDRVSGQTSMPMMVTHAVTPDRSRGLLGGSQPIDITRGWGLLEIYACYGCGLVEWFCGNVAAIPVHPHLMTEVVDYDVDTHPMR